MSESLNVGLRYNVPGWGFLFMVVMANFDRIFDIVNNVGVSFLVVGLSIFGGLPLGFFVSQIYYSTFRALGGYSKIWVKLRPKIRKPIEFLMKSGIKEDKVYYAYDFILHYLSNAGALSYLRRRWDIVHGFRSLGLSFLIGIVVSPFIRILFFNVPISLFNFVTLLVFSIGFLMFSYYITGSIEMEIDEMEYLIIQDF
ncbi:MAG: hypothetical protein ACP5IZ_09900 [Thermoprotei archaeon]